MIRFATVFRLGSILELAVAAPGSLSEITLTFLVVRQKLYRKLIFFTVYVLIVVPWDFLWGWVGHTPRFHELSWIYFFWISQFVFSILRLVAICEICWRALHVYPAVWGFIWRILGGISTLLILWTGISAVHDRHVFRTFITMGFQRFELMEAILLLAVLSAGAYYQIIVPPLYRWILGGIGIYSMIQVANFQLGLSTKYPPLSLFDFILRGSFVAAQLMWVWGIWHWAGVPSQHPALIPQQTYDDLSPQVHDRLREINDRLAGLLTRRR